MGNGKYTQLTILLLLVGAGSAGAVLASRLSEDSHVTVLLIEAGGDDRKQLALDVPILCITNQLTELDWAYQTEPLKHSGAALQNRVCRPIV